MIAVFGAAFVAASSDRLRRRAHVRRLFEAAAALDQRLRRSDHRRRHSRTNAGQRRAATSSTSSLRRSTACSIGSKDCSKTCARSRATSPTTCARLLPRLRNRLELGASRSNGGSIDAAVLEDAIVRVDEVLSLFAAILRIAEVESGETRRFFAPVDLSALATELAESFAPVVLDSGRTLLWSIEPGLTIEGDRELLVAGRHQPARERAAPHAAMERSSGSRLCLRAARLPPGRRQRPRRRQG